MVEQSDGDDRKGQEWEPEGLQSELQGWSRERWEGGGRERTKNDESSLSNPSSTPPKAL